MTFLQELHFVLFLANKGNIAQKVGQTGGGVDCLSPLTVAFSKARKSSKILAGPEKHWKALYLAIK